ncbi:hypothetical protein NKI04_21775 [Mesorhizobium sp. M0814]|uniref:hypothetical protein n=1 Tax=Mesorhizobium sp. M0814 TaxID=2957004 RepID=UPI003334D08D
MAVELESPDRVDPLFDCSTPVLDADTLERAKLLRVQYGGDALVRELHQTYASRLAGLFWDQQEGADSRLVLRLTGDDPVETRKLSICGEPLTVAFIAGQMHTGEELQSFTRTTSNGSAAGSLGYRGPMRMNARARSYWISTFREPRARTSRHCGSMPSPGWALRCGSTRRRQNRG